MFGLIGLPTQSSCATKFAVRGLEALWSELRDAGIGVTSVHPGGVRQHRPHEPHRRRDRQAGAIERFDRMAIAPEGGASHPVRRRAQSHARRDHRRTPLTGPNGIAPVAVHGSSRGATGVAFRLTPSAAGKKEIDAGALASVAR
jgi:NAD(P)-dependent dehydrogenase (short-subunit alcohol dehydrogenase family)